MNREKVEEKALQEIFETLKKCNRIIIFGISENAEDFILFSHGMSFVEILGTLEDIKVRVIQKHHSNCFMNLLQEEEEEKKEELKNEDEKTTH